MLDRWARRRIDPFIAAMARPAAAAGFSANAITLASFATGMVAAYAIARGADVTGLALIVLSRLGDGLDGAVARINGKTDLGGYLDIVLDFVFYGAVPLAFALADPAANALAGAILLFAFYVNGASFLAYAALAQRLSLHEETAASKSIFFSAGLAEASETIVFFALFCIFPAWFTGLALVFAAMTLCTAAARILSAVGTFG